MPPAMPAVVLDNIPAKVRKNGDSTSLAILGSKTGKEVGVCFWRVDPNLPRFTAVFKCKEKRDRWHDSSPLLREMKAEHGVESSLVWYDRKLDQVVRLERGEEQRAARERLSVMDTNNNTMETTMKPLRKPRSVLKEEMQDFDQISNISHSSPVTKGRKDNKKGSPSSGFLSDSECSSSDSEAGSVCRPQAPVLTLGGNSNLLRSLAIDIKKHLGMGETQDCLAHIVAESWLKDLGPLEKLYEHFLADLRLDKESLKRQLSSIYSWPGSPTVSRATALELTELFILRAGSRDDEDLKNRLFAFMTDHKSRYQINKEEVQFILSRNKIDLMTIYKIYLTSPCMATFRQKIQDKVNISGSFFQGFSQVLIDFFLLKSEEGSSERPEPVAKSQTTNEVLHFESKMNVELKNLVAAVERKDYRKSSSLLAEIIDKIESLPDLSQLEEETARLEQEVNSLGEKHQERMKEANQENKVLRSKNSSLSADLAEAQENYEAVERKFSVFSSVLSKFLNEEDLPPPPSEGGEVASLLSGLAKIRSSMTRGHDHCQGSQEVKLVLSDGKTFSVSTNGGNNLCIWDVERQLGRKVDSIHAPTMKGEGYRQMKMNGRYVNCPSQGWGDVVYWVKTEDTSGPNNQGQRRKMSRP